MRKTVSMLECIDRIPGLLKNIFENRKAYQKELFDYLGEEGIQSLNGIVFIGSGTSSTSGTTAMYFCDKVAGVPVRAAIPSEFCHNMTHFDENTLYVFISQTGTSKLTRQAMELVKQKGLKHVCMSEARETPMAKAADCFIDMGCGLEEYPMRTIGYSTTVFSLQMLALEIGRAKGAVSDADYKAYCAEATRLPEMLAPISEKTIDWMQQKSEFTMLHSQCLVFTGSAAQYGAALEAAVKSWEIQKITAIGLELEEGMHGANYGYNQNHCVMIFNDGGVDSGKALSLGRYMGEVFGNGWVIGPVVASDKDLQFDICGENFCCLQFAAVGQTIGYKLGTDMGRDLFAENDHSVMNRYFTTHSQPTERKEPQA